MLDVTAALARFSFPEGWRALQAPEPGGLRLAGPRGQVVQVLCYELSGAEGGALGEAKERLADVLEDAMLDVCDSLSLSPYTPLLAGHTAAGDPVSELHARSADKRASLSQWYCIGPRGGFLLTCEWSGDKQAALETLDTVRGALHQVSWL